MYVWLYQGWALFLFLSLSISATATAVELDSLVDRDLDYEVRPQVNIFHPRLIALWSQALARPEVELKRQSARAIVEAHRLGMTDLVSVIPALVELLRTEDLQDDVAYDVAAALIELEASDMAGTLMRRAVEGNLSLALLIEPVLARWDFQEIRSVWLDRLDQDGVDPVRLALAIDGLSVVKESQAVNSLRRLARDQIKPSEIRLKSALALGWIQREDLESTASDLMSPLSVATGTAGSSATTSLLNRLVSARLLRYHSGDKAVEQLMQLAVDPQGVVASIALERLLEIDPSLVQPINEQIVHSPDARVRWLAGQALTGQATVEAVVLLGGLLDDPIPDVRIQTADQMVMLDADSRLTGTVRSSAMEMLMSDRPRGVEQAAMVLGAIDHEQAADRMVALLYSEVPEVAVASAWGLRNLAVMETNAPILERVRSEVRRTVALDDELWRTWRQVPTPEVDFRALMVTYRQLEQLIQAMGMMEYVPCRELLEEFLPTPPSRGIGDPPAVAATFMVSTRSAAIWALGHLPTGNATDRLVSRLIEILGPDPSNAPAEPSQTRAASALSLGQMDIKSAIPLLRSHCGPLAAHDRVEAACGRTVHKMAGDPLPESVPQEVHQLDWFLEPID